MSTWEEERERIRKEREEASCFKMTAADLDSPDLFDRYAEHLAYSWKRMRELDFDEMIINDAERTEQDRLRRILEA